MTVFAPDQIPEEPVVPTSEETLDTPAEQTALEVFTSGYAATNFDPADLPFQEPAPITNTEDVQPILLTEPAELENNAPPVTEDDLGNDTKEESAAENVSFDPWSDPADQPEVGVIVLCEVGSHLPVEYREYVKGQFDPLTGSYFTTKDGTYQILDVTRWMEVK